VYTFREFDDEWWACYNPDASRCIEYASLHPQASVN
jgi:hypothetical protein